MLTESRLFGQLYIHRQVTVPWKGRYLLVEVEIDSHPTSRSHISDHFLGFISFYLFGFFYFPFHVAGGEWKLRP